ncbi:MAG: 23S rRNA (pseudouridine(1915)-N(3))-methyltransferase RlmH [Butyricicoccus sp.]
MLSVRLICVGKLGEKFWADAVKEYTKRLGAYCKLEIIELPEQRLPQTPSEGEIAQALEKEAALIESKLLPGASVIAMCVEGKPMSSEQLADYFGKLTVSGTSKICVLIGGSCGLSERVKKKAALRLSITDDVPHHCKSDGARADLPLNIAAGGNTTSETKTA